MSGQATEVEGGEIAGRLLRGGSIYGIATLAQLGAGVLILPVLTRVFDSGEYGVITAALVVYNLLSVGIGLGLPTAISRAYFHSDDQEFGREGAVGLIWATALGAVAVAGLLELTGPVWSGIYEGIEYEAPLRIAVWAAVGFGVLQAAQSVLRAEERPVPYVAGAVLATVGAQSLGLGGAIIGGVEEYMAGMGIGVLIAAGFACVAVGAHRTPRFSIAMARRNLRVGFPTVAHSVALYVIAAGDRIVVERLEGLVDVARYHVAFLIGFIVVLLGTALNNASNPIVFGAEPARRWAALAATTATMLRVSAIASAAVAIAAPVALELVAPGAYDVTPLAAVTVLVAASAQLHVWSLACTQVILWEARTWWLALITPLVAAANIGLNFALIPPFGLAGAAIATVLAYALLAGLMLLVVRSAGVRWPWPSAARSLALVVAVAAVALALPSTGAGWLALRGLAGAAIGAVLIVRVAAAVRSRPGPDPTPA